MRATLRLQYQDSTVAILETLNVMLVVSPPPTHTQNITNKLLGLWEALEAIIFICVCRTNLAEKDDEAGLLILALYLEIMAKTIEAIQLAPTHYSQMGKGLDSDTEVSGSSQGESFDEIFFPLFSDSLTLTNAN